MKIKISATHEGKCSVCGCEAVVFTAGDEDTGKVVSVCEGCCKKLGDTHTSDVIEEYGETNKEAFKGSGIEIKGLDKIQAELEKKKKSQEPAEEEADKE
jgi:hypothetical protein